MLTLQNVKSHLTSMIIDAQDDLEKWSLLLSKHPTQALEWSDAVYLNAARLETARKYMIQVETAELRAMEKHFDPELIVEQIRQSAMSNFVYRAGQSTNRSTSQGHNLLDAARVEVLAKLVEWLQDKPY